MSGLPSKQWRKCLTARYNPRSSLENVEYLHCAGEKLLEKNSIGRHALSMRCMMEAPQPKFESSETSTVSASERGWAEVAWLHRASFRFSNATSASLLKTKVRNEASCLARACAGEPQWWQNLELQPCRNLMHPEKILGLWQWSVLGSLLLRQVFLEAGVFHRHW